MANHDQALFAVHTLAPMKKEPARDRVSDQEWISQQDAARRLGVNLAKVAMLIANDHLVGAGNSNDDTGVTLASLATEVAWRESASAPARMGRLVRDTVRWV
jgi:hypothetical protein